MAGRHGLVPYGGVVNEPQLLARIEGSLGHLTLNRPRSLNALNPSMIVDLHEALIGWADDPAVEAVLIDGAGHRGLCAGGDIKMIYDGITADTLVPLEFWVREYEMNASIANFPKPYVAFMDGLCLGGGIGVSAHGSVRIVTERSQLAMPETAIGLSPDVGSLYLLARAPGGLGTYLALTGSRLGPADAIVAGLADFCCASSALPELLAGLRAGLIPGAADAIDPGPSALSADRSWIDPCFGVGADSIEEIANRLAQRPEPAAAATLVHLRAMSPTALKVTLAAIRRAATLPTVEDVLAQDLRVSSAFTRHPDLIEGIRAMVVDKDRNPRWQPARWEDVTPAEVQSYFD